MFSKKKKGDTKAEPAGEKAAAENAPKPAAESAAAAPSAPAENSSHEPSSTGGLASGLGAKAKTPSISASRLGGRPPSRPSAPAPPPAPAPAESPASSALAATPTVPAIPFGGFGGFGGAGGVGPSPVSSASSGASEPEGRSGRISNMKEAPVVSQSGLTLQDAGPDGGVKIKNPYKLNPLFDILLPVSMAFILCGGFALTIKIQKDRHAIYGYSDAEKQIQVRVQALADPKLMEEIKKMEPLKLLDNGSTAAAITSAKAVGLKAASLAADKYMGTQAWTSTHNSKSDLAVEEKAARDLLVSGMVLCRAGTKQEQELGLTYMAKAEEIATYSKYVRLLYARELVLAKKRDEAIEQYQKITTLFKDPWPVPHKELGLLYMRANRGQEAVQELSDLVKTDPSDPSIPRQLGLAMAQNEDQQGGFAEFQKGFTREQDVLSYPAAVRDLVDAHGGLVDATLADVRKAADKNPQDIKTQLDLARLLIATGKFKEARDVLEKARKTHELNPEVHEVMAEVMCRQSQQTSGYDEFRAAAQNLLQQ